MSNVLNLRPLKSMRYFRYPISVADADLKKYPGRWDNIVFLNSKRGYCPTFACISCMFDYAEDLEEEEESLTKRRKPQFSLHKENIRIDVSVLPPSTDKKLFFMCLVYGETEDDAEQVGVI